MAEPKTSPEEPVPEKTIEGRETWHRLLRLSRRLLREIDARLEHEHRIGVNEFDVLITLDNASGRRLRMTDLAQAVMFSSGGLTRLVGRLESRGLVERIADPDDARSFYAGLTGEGSQMLAQARIAHDGAIEELLTAKLTKAELGSLARSLGNALEL